MKLNSLARRAWYFAGLSAITLATALAQDPIPPPRTPGNLVTSQNTTNGVVRAKASADECYLSLGNNVPYDLINQANPAAPCSPGKKPKINQSYVWGIVPDGNFIFFGTTSNGQCITQGGVVPDPTTLTAYETSSWACEFGDSPYSPSPLPAQIGDFRPARFYIYDRVSKKIRDITPKLAVSPTNPLGLDPLWLQLRGARASMIYSNSGRKLVIVAGPALAADGRVNWFAFDITALTATTDISLPALPAGVRWISKFQQTGIDNIRRWQNVGGIQYAGVGKSLDAGGGIIRFAGNFATVPAPTPTVPIPVCPACFANQLVANFDGEGAYLSVQGNRLYATTWPKPGEAGLFMSPVIPPTGLTTADANLWTKVWKVSDYEPETSIVPSYAGGATYSYGGWIYWGTMNVPLASLGTFIQTYGPPVDQAAGQELLTKGWRAALVFRGKDFDTATPTVELLYGDQLVWKYTGPTGPWVQVPNVKGYLPKFGKSGFGNPYTNYIWSMTEWNGKLYVGTMDWSFMAAGIGQVIGSPLPTPGVNFGADLWVFNNALTKAVLETDQGFGNAANYGIRNLVPISSTQMFVAMANAMNLLPAGGWELIEVTPRSTGVGR
ncbi:MAG: hypothetical protein SFV18_20545 [Bryobacteraceae bacterium]|nr:hypothetical protein [Bryobacteraceae bacterium]